MSKINADVDLYFEDTGGTGRPVVLIHGWPLSGESWKHQVPALQQAGYRVITYDRRGFGRSDKPLTGYDYKSLTSDLNAVLEALDLTDVTLVGFSMGGGEVARYIGTYGVGRIRSVVLASSVTPFMLKSPDNPDGPLTAEKAAVMAAGLTADEQTFYDEFTTDFFSANGELVVSEDERLAAIAIAMQSLKEASLQAMAAFGSTDFRDDLPKITVPALIIHGDDDAIVLFDGSGARTHAALPDSDLYVVAGGPHGVNVSHTDEWNRVVLEFLEK